jgi:hypothetical protein
VGFRVSIQVGFNNLNPLLIKACEPRRACSGADDGTNEGAAFPQSASDTAAQVSRRSDKHNPLPIH